MSSGRPPTKADPESRRIRPARATPSTRSASPATSASPREAWVWVSGITRSSRTDRRSRAIPCRSPARLPSEGRNYRILREKEGRESDMAGPVLSRTYNQNHVPRKYQRGKRRVSIYWTWSYPWEANRNTSELDNRFSTITEVRRVAWPTYEGTEWDAMNFLQGIEGTLELFHRSTLDFQRAVGEVTDQPVAVFQRIDQAGYKLPIDERVLADTDTLLVFGLDHLVSEQEASADEISAIREWLKREGTCLLIGPHHDVGSTVDREQRQMEYRHHGDEMVPRQQRFGQYTRSLMKALDVPVMNQYGLRPATVRGQPDQIAPLTGYRDLDSLGLLRGVATFNYHLHLPHYAATSTDPKVIVLSTQAIDSSRPHPFTEAGNKEFNSFLWMPPAQKRGGHILLVDLTVFTTLFGGTDSLKQFWLNVAGI